MKGKNSVSRETKVVQGNFWNLFLSALPSLEVDGKDRNRGWSDTGYS
jgi:hypothetical protein